MKWWVFGAILALTGCATLSPDECRTANWHSMGFEDGAAGNRATRLAEHQGACVKVGILPDAQSYAAGRAEGLKSYCTAEAGYRSGRRGDNYQGVCPADTMHSFMPAYERGRNYYEIMREIDDMENQLRIARKPTYLIDSQGNTIKDKYGKPIQDQSLRHNEWLLRSQLDSLRYRLRNFELYKGY